MNSFTLTWGSRNLSLNPKVAQNHSIELIWNLSNLYIFSSVSRLLFFANVHLILPGRIKLIYFLLHIKSQKTFRLISRATSFFQIEAGRGERNHSSSALLKIIHSGEWINLMKHCGTKRRREKRRNFVYNRRTPSQQIGERTKQDVNFLCVEIKVDFNVIEPSRWEHSSTYLTRFCWRFSAT